MKKIDSIGLKMCNYQAVLFEKSIDELGCSSAIFIRRFMNSSLAKRMDSNGFIFESLEVTDALIEIETEYGTSTYGKEKYSKNEIYWMGYIYRYWSCISGKTSKQLYKMLKPEELRKRYFPYHTMDPFQAIERIIEEISPDANYDVTDIARGVEIYRKVRYARAKRLEEQTT